MAQMLVRGLDENVVATLKERASRNGRSLEAEIKAILEREVAGSEPTPKKPGKPRRKIRIVKLRPPGAT